jgi:hypothetical protein
VSAEDRKMRRAARRAQTLAEHGLDAWRPGTRVIPSGKLYSRTAKHSARRFADA